MNPGACGSPAGGGTPSVVISPPQRDVSATCTDRGTDKLSAATSVDTGLANCMPTIDSVGSLLLAQLMPQKTKFSGESLDNKPFDDWLTQFEMIPGLCKWEGLTKLVHLTTRLRGPAFAFYKSCSAAETSNYQSLVGELRKRFTPVHSPNEPFS